MMGDTSKTSTSSTSAVFHEFLGNNKSAATLHDYSSAGFPPDSSPSAEKQANCQFERVPSYGQRTDLSVSEISYQLVGSKRNHSDCAVIGLSREGVPQVSPDKSHVMKMLRNQSGERLRLSNYEGHLHNSDQFRPVPASYMLQQSGGAYARLAKFDRSIPLNVGGGSMSYSAHARQGSPVMYQVPSNRLIDAGSVPSALSQLAADEGSRTGNKSSGPLQSFDPCTSFVSERHRLGQSGCNVKSTVYNPEPELSIPQSRRGVTSSTRQMTIIFDGQLHVFDDVLPNKAEIIMALAGSNGGSWSTTLPEPSVKEATNNLCLRSKEKEITTACDLSLRHKYSNLQCGGAHSVHRSSARDEGELFAKAVGSTSQAPKPSMETKQEI